ncbi:Rrf2 family transcriptional regulator [Gracilibacillus thailandensis]|uniref:Rrf2 family transcriptional regulator n=1 Tax=Gracilibacillus thailandensis TaxID=563735 RepID=A0A6N7R6C9_9BACI|nr:Rrf2 family transcriptional regulator [Gracilibacillus thailandensis]MRI68724.1 Rrf2 family transcriptional regulator [Gracilibacillus thailandensis]
MINTRFSVAIHILTLVATQNDKGVTSDFIAKSVNTNPVVIRRIGSLLKKANLLKGGPGVAGYSLVIEPSKITLLDIYRAVTSEEELFAVHDHPNPNCDVGRNIQATLDFSLTRAQKAMENELNKQTLADIIQHLSIQ